MPETLDYEKDMAIDPDGLDVEWLAQPGLMMRYGRHAAWAKTEMDKVKERLDVIRAGADKAIRENPSAFGIAKITETVIANTILMDEQFVEVNEEFIEAKYEADMAQVAVRAMDQRKTALENLVRLYMSLYFAGPKVLRNISKEWEEKKTQDEVDRGINSNLLKLKRTKPPINKE